MGIKLACAVLAVIAAASAVPHKKHEIFSRDPIDNSDVYDCSGHADGQYPHPTDCTRFIMCSNGRTSDMPCADCDQNNVNGCAGSPYLFYDVGSERCEWPADVDCEGDSSSDSSEEPGPEPTTTPAPEDECANINEGDACETPLEDCHHCGWCHNLTNYYFRCDRTFPDDPKHDVTGHWLVEQCDDDLWWNPHGAPEGGSCDWWDNLSPAVQEAYKNDPDCVPPLDYCEWGQDEEDKCTGKYWYKPEGGSRQDLECNDDLLWDPATETCRVEVDGCDSGSGEDATK